MEWIGSGNILLVGLGLIGGSYALALKELGFHITAIDSRNEAIEFALKNDIIDEGYSYVEEAFVSKADACIFALYPGVFVDWIEKYQKYFKSGIRITDVTGVKSNVVEKIQNILRKDVEYIPAHPMAGKEVYGVENADPSIFRGANYIVTPTDKNTKEAIEWCSNLGKILGFKNISVLSPDNHDDMIGFVSQLTHCIAISLMGCNDNEHLAEYTGDSFRDLTRIARINENMWSELFLENKEYLIAQMERFETEFDSLKQCIIEGNEEALKEKMRTSTKRRAWFDK